MRVCHTITFTAQNVCIIKDGGRPTHKQNRLMRASRLDVNVCDLFIQFPEPTHHLLVQYARVRSSQGVAQQKHA